VKSYLSLISLSAKVHRRQNRMTILCIVFAVFLVTAIFTIADLGIRAEEDWMLAKHGAYHLSLKNISQETAAEIGRRSDVTAIGVSTQFNFEGLEPYYVEEKKAVLYCTDETYLAGFFDGITEGAFPQNDSEVLLSPNAALAIQAKTGERVTLHTPAGDREFTVSGIGTDDKSYYEGQTYLVGVYMNRSAFASMMEQNGIDDLETVYYVQFQDAAAAAKAKPELSALYGLDSSVIQENVGVMGMAGQSDNSAMNGFYGIAAVLFVMVLLAGILMISGSMNSNIAQRTQFFGMLRCVGASRRQIIRFVRLEALAWCKMAVPAGLILGTCVSWAICAALRYGIGGEFSKMVVFGVSPVGLISGVAVGILTVILAAQSPAKRAARVSPVSAISGSENSTGKTGKGTSLVLGKVECALGVHHAFSSKKGWLLLSASFALTILLFLSFSVVLDFAQLLMPSQNPTSADMAINGYDNAKILDRSMVDQIRKIPGVAAAYGVTYQDGIPATSSQGNIDHINLVSYDDTLMDYAKDLVAQGSLEEVYGSSTKVATVFNKKSPLRVGDVITVGSEQLEIACALSQGLFGDDLIVICSQETYDRLMGIENYMLIGIQLRSNATEETAAQIRSYENRDIIVADERESNRTDNSTYYASRILVYGFLAIIGIITLFNILNSISMSVSARIRQYGAMRAVGMDCAQLTRMIAAESFTYAASGLILGCCMGIPLSRFLYKELITRHFGLEWHLPLALFAIVTIFILAAAAIAVYAPAKRIREMAITATINDL